VQAPTCLPEGDQYSEWPVKVVYMHGWFEPSGTTFDCGLEAANRAKLREMAKDLHVRIAVPVGEVSGGHHQWNGRSLSSVESSASNACGGAPLADGRALLGFSNGCYGIRDIVNKAGACDLLAKHYARVAKFGCPGHEGINACGDGGIPVFHQTDHSFPASRVARQLEYIRPPVHGFQAVDPEKIDVDAGK
jgi:hypothetical protein